MMTFSEGLRMKKQILLAAGAQLIAGASLAATMQYDIVIAGGSLGAPPAAMAAARANPNAQILLLEPTDWLGGQATTQGVAAPDNPWHDPGRTTMLGDRDTYFPADYMAWLRDMENLPAQAPGIGYQPTGTNWVSVDAFDPRSAAWMLDQMVADFPNITVMKMAVVKEAATQSVTDEFGTGARITGLTVIERTPRAGYTPHDDFLHEEFADWYDPADSPRFTKETHTIAPRHTQKGIVVIDASETGDVIVNAGARYTIGRERFTEEMSESGQPPEMDEDGGNAIVFPFAMTSAASAPHDESEVQEEWPDFDAYYADRAANFYSFQNASGNKWARVWTYRRLYAAQSLWNVDVAQQGDVSMQNWNPGNDYLYECIFLDSAAAAAQAASGWMGGLDLDALRTAELHALGWYFFLKNNRNVTWDTELLRGDHPFNMMGTRHGLAKFPYIRGNRRVIGLHNFRITERYFDETSAGTYDGGTSFRFFDSVGIGNYAADVRPIRGSVGIAPTDHTPAPFYIPYRSLGVENVRNLLAAGKQFAQTFITNSAYRLHPIEWAAGSAAGSAAGLMARDGVRNYDLLERGRLRELQTTVAQNSPIHWQRWDSEVIPPRYGDLIINDRATVFPGDPLTIEMYHPYATRAVVSYSGEPLGETATRANGRLVLEAATAPLDFNEAYLGVLLYDDDGNLLDNWSAPPAPPPPAFAVVDDADPAFTTIGGWINATAQANKWAASYKYIFGSSGSATATWALPIERSGDYLVSVWYPESGNRAVDSPYTVHHAAGNTTIRVNQRTNGGRWVLLGTFPFAVGGDGRVVLTNAISETSNLVVADAVRIERLADDAWLIY